MNFKYKISLKSSVMFLGMILFFLPSLLLSDTIKNMDVEGLEKKVVHIKLPEVPKVPTLVVETNGETSSNHLDRSIKFSKRIPPNYLTSKERYGKDGKGGIGIKNSIVKVGEVEKGRLSAYLRGDLMKKKTAIKRLKGAGFEILDVRVLTKNRKLLSIVFTNEKLKKMASKKNRGFLATLRFLVDVKHKQISITNPLYLAKAMLQNDFDEKGAKEILASLVKAFPNVKNSMDKLKYQLLPKYQFMNGMPYYEDMAVLARGNDLLAKVEKNKKRVSFVLKLNNGSTLVGVKLSKRTKKFPRKIGTKNAGMLPYPLLIEDGEAKILDPKYYLALMYPQLTMEEFMTIATVPEAITKDCSKVFR